MKIIWKSNVGKNNIEIGGVIRTNYIRGVFTDVAFSLDGIKDAGKEEDNMCPNFFQFPGMFKPTLTTQKKDKKRIKHQKRQQADQEKPDTPDSSEDKR